MSGCDSDGRHFNVTDKDCPRRETTCFPQVGIGVPKTVAFNDVECGISEKEMEPDQDKRPPLSEFERSLKSLINKYSMENKSATPDFILAEYLSACLVAFEQATRARERWYGRRVF